jgi:predicted MFS family arabinose efflux permease
MRLTGLWTHPDFVRLWSASTVSVFGSLITRTALPFAAILALGATPSQVGWLSIAELLPGFVIGLGAGAWIDRRRRRPVMIGADLGRAAILLLVPLAALLGALSLPLLIAVAAAISVLNVAFDVAYQSYLPTLVRRDELVEGNSKLTAAASVAEAASFGMGGWLVQLLTAPVAIAVDAVTFVASALFVGAIRAPEPHPAGAAGISKARPSLRSEIADGMRLIWRDGALRALVGSNAGLAFSFGVGSAAYLVYVSRVLGFSPGVLGLIFGLGGVASLVGALAAGRLARFPIGPVMVACFVVAAIGQALVPLATAAGPVAVALLVAQQFVSDPAYTVYEINQVSLRQGMVPDALLGRVNATVRVSEVGAQILGALLGGYVGDAYGARAALVVGLTGLLLAALWLFRSPVRALRRIPPPIVAVPAS